jgi:hypothetical protein
MAPATVHVSGVTPTTGHDRRLEMKRQRHNRTNLSRFLSRIVHATEDFVDDTLDSADDFECDVRHSLSKALRCRDDRDWDRDRDWDDDWDHDGDDDWDGHGRRGPGRGRRGPGHGGHRHSGNGHDGHCGDGNGDNGDGHGGDGNGHDRVGHGGGNPPDSGGGGADAAPRRGSEGMGSDLGRGDRDKETTGEADRLRGEIADLTDRLTRISAGGR